MSQGELIPEYASETTINYTNLGILPEIPKLIYNYAYHELCEPITGKKPSKEPPPEHDFKVRVLQYINENREKMYQKICIEFNYCERRRNAKNMSGFINGLAALLETLLESTTIGAGSAIWFMSTSMLDELCKCQ